MYNSVLLMDKYAEHDSYLRSKETKEASKQISMIQSRDRGVYRITQTYAGINANYDEAFAHNYWSLAGYTSSPNDMQRAFWIKQDIISWDRILRRQYLHVGYRFIFGNKIRAVLISDQWVEESERHW